MGVGSEEGSFRAGFLLRRPRDRHVLPRDDQWRRVDAIYDEALQVPNGDDYKLARIQLSTGRAFHYFEGERSTRAMDTARRALDLIQHEYGPKSAEAGIGLGLRFLAEVLAGEFELADKTLSEALAVEKPESRIAPVFMEYPVEAYDELIKTLGELGSDFYSERGRTDEARDLLRRAASLPVKLETKAEIVQRMIRFLEKEGKAEEAQREREQILKELEASTSADHAKTAQQIAEAAAQPTGKAVEERRNDANAEAEVARTRRWILSQNREMRRQQHWRRSTTGGCFCRKSAAGGSSSEAAS